MPDKLNIAILGASGYTGAELIRLLDSHPYVNLVALTGDSKAGMEAAAVYPHLRGLGLPALSTIDSLDWSGIDAVFCCLPHGASQKAIPQIPARVVVIDLSADYRLKDAALYERWYNEPHHDAGQLADAVYGLSELAKDAVAKARLIACPGCYPTSIQLPLIPLLSAKVIEPQAIIIDAKSGVSGAGRSVKQGNLFSEVNEGIGAYGIGNHRHAPEIEQGLSQAAGKEVVVSFTPHLVPMNRGILSTIYASLAPGKTIADARAALAQTYVDTPFVTLAGEGETPPTTHQVRGTNRCMIGLYADRRPGGIILVSVIDNLVKGASGQAVQNFNIRFGFEETLGLGRIAVFP